MISVVVCTYNRAGTLRQMLEAFFAQRDLAAVNHELIVVDNNSSDNTPVVVDEFRRFPSLRYVVEERLGLSCARNRGVAEANGEIVAFLDDDAIVDKGWLVKLQECFDATTADVVGGRSYLIFEKHPSDWFGPYFGRLLSQVDLGQFRKVVSDGRGLLGLNLSFRRSALVGDAPFDENLGRKGSGLLGGEETTLVRSIAGSGGVVVYDPDAVVGHLISADRVEWDYFKRVTRGMGESFALAEPDAGMGTQMAGVLWGLISVFYRLAAMLWMRLARKSPYERRVSACRLRAKTGFLIGRTKRLWRSA